MGKEDDEIYALVWPIALIISNKLSLNHLGGPCNLLAVVCFLSLLFVIPPGHRRRRRRLPQETCQQTKLT